MINRKLLFAAIAMIATIVVASAYIDKPGGGLTGVATAWNFNSAGSGQFGLTVATATNLTPPKLATTAEICVETAGVRYRDDGSTSVGSILGTTYTTTSTMIGTVAIGQTLTDQGGMISGGTTITGGSGTTWTVNNSQTVSARTIYGVTPPTTTLGTPVIGASSAPACFQYTGPLFAVEFIAISGSPTLDVSYYQQTP